MKPHISNQLGMKYSIKRDHRACRSFLLALDYRLHQGPQGREAYEPNDALALYGSTVGLDENIARAYISNQEEGEYEQMKFFELLQAALLRLERGIL